MRVVHPFPEPARARVDVGFLDPAYPAWRRRNNIPPAEHPGLDLNLVGTAGNEDLGYPVVAIADGVVAAARTYPVWGNIVLIEHPELAEHLGMPYLASQYAHLAHMCVAPGQRVWAGEPVGSIGRGDRRRPYLAHLHFEVRRAKLPADNWYASDKAAILRDYLDPAVFLAERDADRRFRRARSRLYGTPGSGAVVINLSDPYVAHIRWEDSA